MAWEEFDTEEEMFDRITGPDYDDKTDRFDVNSFCYAIGVLNTAAEWAAGNFDFTIYQSAAFPDDIPNPDQTFDFRRKPQRKPWLKYTGNGFTALQYYLGTFSIAKSQETVVEDPYNPDSVTSPL